MKVDTAPTADRARHAAAFAAFVRAVRAIADDPARDSVTKAAELRGISVSLTSGTALSSGIAEVDELRRTLATTGISEEHARHIVEAAEKDLRTPQMRSWSEVVSYCRYAAAPWGRFLLELHGEGRAAWTSMEALCAARLIAGRVNRCAGDYRAFGRVILPADWLRQAGTGGQALAGSRADPALRKVFGLCLDRVSGLLAEAERGLRHVRDRQLRHDLLSEAAMLDRLVRKLRRADPLVGPVAIGPLDRWLGGLRARLVAIRLMRR